MPDPTLAYHFYQCWTRHSCRFSCPQPWQFQRSRCQLFCIDVDQRFHTLPVQRARYSTRGRYLQSWSLYRLFSLVSGWLCGPTCTPSSAYLEDSRCHQGAHSGYSGSHLPAGEFAVAVDGTDRRLGVRSMGDPGLFGPLRPVIFLNAPLSA